MDTILLDTAKGLLFLVVVGLIFWISAQTLMFIYAVLGDNIGYLALIPTGLVLAYLFGQAISAQKEFPN